MIIIINRSKYWGITTCLINSNFFADDESVVSSSISVNSANQNQKQNHNDLTDPSKSGYRSQVFEVCENDDIPGQFISNKRAKQGKRKIDNDFEDQCCVIRINFHSSDGRISSRKLSNYVLSADNEKLFCRIISKNIILS
jgi:hypothetical protein